MQNQNDKNPLHLAEGVSLSGPSGFLNGGFQENKMKLQVASITLLGTHAVLNGTIDTGVAGVPGQPYNFPVSNDEVYDRTFIPGQTYDFTLGATPDVQPDTTAQQPNALPTSA